MTYTAKTHYVQVPNKYEDLELKEVYEYKPMNYKDLNKNYKENENKLSFKNHNYVLKNLPNCIYDKAAQVCNFADMQGFIYFLQRYLKSYDCKNTVDYATEYRNNINKMLIFTPKESGHRTIYYFLSLNEERKHMSVSCQKFLLPYQISNSFTRLYNLFINHYNPEPLLNLFKGNVYTWYKMPYYNIYNNNLNPGDWNDMIINNQYCLGNPWDFLEIGEIIVRNMLPTNKFDNDQLMSIALYFIEYLHSFDFDDIQELVLNTIRANVAAFTLMFIDKPNLPTEILYLIFQNTFTSVSICFDETFTYNLNLRYTELHYFEF